MDSSTLYSTIATINGVWISLLFSLGLVLFTHIINQNVTFFTSIRNEKKKLLNNHIHLKSMGDLSKDIGKYNETSDQEVQTNLSDLLNHIEVEYLSPKFTNQGPAKKTDRIRSDLQNILSYYPEPINPQITFESTKETKDSNEYNEWLQKHKARIDPIILESALLKISNANPLYGTTMVYDGERKTLEQVEPLKKALTEINNSIETIEAIHADYEPIEVIVGQVRPILLRSFAILLFGVFLPIYMLLPYHFNMLSESAIIWMILLSLTILYMDIVYKIDKIMTPVLKYGR